MPIPPFTIVRRGAVELAGGINPDFVPESRSALSEVIIAARSQVLGGEQVHGDGIS